MKRTASIPLILGILLLSMACREKQNSYYWKSKEVTVSAFNSVPWQTDTLHNLAAWGDTLKPGMKCVAISRDLFEMGLDYNTPLKIEGLKGMYLVKDKMHFRWRNKIDIYMGTDIKKARKWGRKKLTIYYPAKKDSLSPVPE